MSFQRREIMTSNNRTSSPSTSSNTIPSPPSQPSLTQSDSTSLSRSPEDLGYRPRTPARRRYPDNLGPGHVPLHRRGTSQTYESLEDLLREAGYADTRVFTPESERTATKGNSPVGDSSAGGVVGFLSGLIPGGLSRNSSLQPENVEATYSPPSSPLSKRNHVRPPLSPHMKPPIHQLPHPNPNAAFPDTTVRASHGQPKVYAQDSQARAYLRHMASAPSLPRRLMSSAPRAGVKRPGILHGVVSQSHLRNAAGPSSRRTITITSDDSDDDGAFERGNGEGEVDPPPPMPRTWLESVARAVLGGGKGAYAGGPQHSVYPGSREESMYVRSQTPSRAVSPTRRLDSGRSGSMDPSATSRPEGGFTARRVPALRHAASSLSQVTLAAHDRAQSRQANTILSDHTNRAGLERMSSTRSLRPDTPQRQPQIPRRDTMSTRKLGTPPRMRIPRAETSEGAVSCTRVMCRSAPASRASSPGLDHHRVSRQFLRAKTDVSSATDLLLGYDLPRGKGKRATAEPERGRQRIRRSKSSFAAADGMPSLANTQTKGDVWSQVQRGARQGASDSTKETYAQRIARLGADDGMSSSEGEGGSEMDYNSSSDEEDGTRMDLARLLVHPKRQHSIISLRRHLHSPHPSAQGHAPSSPLHPRRNTDSAMTETDEDEEVWGTEDISRRGGIGSGW